MSIQETRRKSSPGRGILSLLEPLGEVSLRVLGVEHYKGSVEITDEVRRLFFRRARYYVKLVEGELDDGFYLNREIQDVIEDIVEKGVKIEIVTGPDHSRESKDYLVGSGAKIYFLGDRPPVHFCVVDGIHILIEEYHIPGQREREFYIRHNDLGLGGELTARFESLKRSATESTNKDSGS